MDGPLGGGDPEFLGVFFHVGFRGGINRKASSGVDVFIYVLVHSFYGFLYHSLYGLMVTGVQNFPQSGGTIVGIMKVHRFIYTC